MQSVLQQRLNVAVVTSAWVDACRQAGARLPFDQFRLPPMQSCLVSFTNMTKPRRVALEGPIKAAGGSIAPDMSRNSTHLVVGDATKPSAKLQCAPPSPASLSYYFDALIDGLHSLARRSVLVQSSRRLLRTCAVELQS